MGSPTHTHTFEPITRWAPPSGVRKCACGHYAPAVVSPMVARLQAGAHWCGAYDYTADPPCAHLARTPTAYHAIVPATEDNVR